MPTPRFFKKMIGVGFSIVAVGSYLATLEGFYGEAGTHMIVAGTALMIAGKSAIKEKTN